MHSTNGHGLKRSVLWAILYARVSTDEQARFGYSLAQQIEALRAYAAREGYEVLEEEYERAKMTERSRRGKLRKAREGKVIAGRMAHHGAARYGFTFNDARDALVVDEEKMAVVRRIFRMVGVEGQTIFAAKRMLDAAGIPTATGKPRWSASMIRDIISNDVYRPHSIEEVEPLVSQEVAARLDPQQIYGLWKWGIYRHIRSQVSEVGSDGTRVYRTQQRREARPEEEWVYVPVPDSGVPREWVDAAREAIKDNRKCFNAGRRFWELSGGILRCGECGWTMQAHNVVSKANNRLFYYCCKAKYKKGVEFCQASRTHRAEKLEARVWGEVRSYLEEPERLRADLDRKIELERSGTRGEPEREMKLWAEKLAETDAKRVRFQHAYAEGIVGLDDLKARLAELDDARTTADQEITILEGRIEHVRSLEEDRDAVLADLEAMAPKVLDCLDPEERHRFYKMLRLRVRLWPDRSLEITGAFPEPLKVGARGLYYERITLEILCANLLALRVRGS